MSCSITREVSLLNKNIDYPDMVQLNYIHSIFKNSRVYLRADIKKAEFFFKKRTIECDQFAGVINDIHSKIITEVYADHASIDEKRKTVLMSGNVKFKSYKEKTTVYCQEMKFDYNLEKLTIDKEVLIEKEDGSYLKATSMESELKSQTTTFTGMDMMYFYKDDDEK